MLPVSQPKGVRPEVEGVLARKLKKHPLSLIGVDEINDDLLGAIRKLGSVR
jgi:hypothetical protein